MVKQCIAGEVCRSRLLLTKRGEAGYCFACFHKLGVDGQVCGSRILLGKCAEAGFC